MTNAWPAARIARVLFGVLVLVTGGVLAYINIRSAGEAKSVSEGSLNFRVHDAPRPLPELAFEDVGGRGRTLADFRDKTVLLNVWATWCVPCREEMPALDRLQQKLGGPGFEVVALSIDVGGAAAVKRFYDEIGIRALAIHVDRSTRATSTLGIIGLPTTLLIDREGREIGRRTGPAQWDGPEAVRMITGYIDTAAKP